LESLHFLLRNRDGKYSQAFDAIFQCDDLRTSARDELPPEEQ